MWTIELLEGVLGTWNDYMSQIWQIVTQSPKEFQGGAIWPAMQSIFSVLQGIGYGLLILFFAMSFFKHTASFRELRHPEQVFRLFIRFVLAQASIAYGLEIINFIFEITGGITETIASSMNGLHQVAAQLPDAIKEAVEEANIIDRAFIYLIGLVLAGFVIVLSLTLLLTVYGRFFRIYMYVAIAPLPLSTFAGELTSRHGRNFIQSFIGVGLEAAIVVIACIIFSAFTAATKQPPIDLGNSGVGLVMSYMLGIIFQMLILVGVVKGTDRVVKEVLAL